MFPIPKGVERIELRLNGRDFKERRRVSFVLKENETTKSKPTRVLTKQNEHREERVAVNIESVKPLHRLSNMA
jgi:hypothetical protein